MNINLQIPPTSGTSEIAEITPQDHDWNAADWALVRLTNGYSVIQSEFGLMSLARAVGASTISDLLAMEAPVVGYAEYRVIDQSGVPRTRVRWGPSSEATEDE